MGKASSAKKVARAARAGGSRRPGQRRNLGFPLTIMTVIGLGLALVIYATTSRAANAEPRSQATDSPDHWHAAYGIYQCDAFIRDTDETALVDVGQDRLGIHTHGDGVIHIHPFINSASGRDARLRLFFDQVDMQVTETSITFSDGESLTEGEDTCGDEAGQVQIAKWNDAQAAEDGEPPNEIITEDFGDIRFRADTEYYTIAFAPEGAEIPARDGIIADLSTLTDIGPTEGLEAPSSTTPSTEPQTSDTSSSLPPGDTSTTAPPESSTTTAGG